MWYDQSRLCRCSMLTTQEILESSVCVEQAAELSQYYGANAANYLRTIKQLPDPA